MTGSTEHEIKAGVDLGRVRATVEPALSSLGVQLVDVEWLTERVGWTLRVTIEREGALGATLGGGVTLADCADVSREVSAALDAHEDLIPHQYHLEVSSPGVDRPLRTPADFVRFVGQAVKVKLRKPAPDGQKVLRGPLAEAGAESVAVVVDGKRIEVPFADVGEAHLVFELGAQPKKKPSAKSKKINGARAAGSASSKRQ